MSLQTPELALETSEDIATRELDGSLGAYAARRLAAWPKVLDAVAALEPRQTSRVVETRFGFHVFERRPPRPELRFSASRIIIGHDDASWLHKHLARDTVPRRFRAEALALADDIYRRALAAPNEFARLVNESSEHKDAARDGDFGEWSTREATPFRHALEVASQLDVGGIAPSPICTTTVWLALEPDHPRPNAASPIAASEGSWRACWGQSPRAATRPASSPTFVSCSWAVRRFSDGREQEEQIQARSL